MRRLALVSAFALVAALALVACEPQSGSNLPGVTMLLARNPAPDLREARVDGQLVIDEGCLWLESARGDPTALLWPHDSTLVAGGGIPVVTVRGTVVPIGADVSLRGGVLHDADRIDQMIFGQLPDACRAPDYVLVDAILAIDGTIVIDAGPDE